MSADLVKLSQTPQHDLASPLDTAVTTKGLVPFVTVANSGPWHPPPPVSPLTPAQPTCTVLSLCAMTTTVRPLTNRCTACCTSFSLTESSALVASSRMMMGESLSSARAIAIRCRCPPVWGGRVQNSKRLL